MIPCLAVVGAACEQVLGIEGDVVVIADGGVAACGILAGPASCASCVESSCCAPVATCASDDACTEYESCLLPCQGDYACRSQCNLDHGVNSATVATVDQCVAVHCHDECGISCGEVNVPTSPDAAAACASCITQRACGAGEACGDDVDCHLVAQCRVSCATLDCAEACDDGHEAGAALFESLTSAGVTCAEPCAVGTNWSCLGKRSLPLTAAPQSHVVLSLVSFAQSPVPGVTATVCASGDEACATHYGSGTTDANGQVTLSLPPLPAGAFGFAGYFELTGPTIVPELFFLGAGLSEPDAVVTIATIDPTTFSTDLGDLDASADPSRGSLLFVASDCYLVGAPGVVATIGGGDSETRTFYFSEGVVSATATSTDGIGGGLVLGIPAGFFTLTVTPQSVGRPASQVSLFARAGWISAVVTVPNQ